MATHFSGTCSNCGCPISEVDYRCPYCHTRRRSGSNAGGVLGVLIGVVLGAVLLAAQIDKATGSDYLGTLRDMLMP